MTPTSGDGVERFGERYALSGAAVMLGVELEALGSDYQANGYMTIDQADDLGRLLELGPGQILLDVGAGCGWPGLYLARTTGCAVVSLDPVAEGVGAAGRRATEDGQDERSWPIQADARNPPIKTGSVDAVVHNDVLC